MKWFKHEVDAIHSEKLTRLKSEFGFEGYGRYWRIMEIVAERMDGSNRCHAELPEKEWLNLLSIRRPLFDRYLFVIGSLFDSWRITTDKEKLLIRIEIPNLLEKRDNYTSDLQASSKKLPNRSRSRKEEDKESLSLESSLKKTASKPSANPDVKVAIDHYSDEYLRIHGTRPHVNGAACKTFQALLNTKPIEQVNTLTTGYLSLVDEKLRDKGFPIEWMQNHINRLLMAEKKSERGFVF
jgi:hypothetical protein